MTVFIQGYQDVVMNITSPTSLMSAINYVKKPIVLPKNSFSFRIMLYKQKIMIYLN